MTQETIGIIYNKAERNINPTREDEEVHLVAAVRCLPHQILQALILNLVHPIDLEISRILDSIEKDKERKKMKDENEYLLKYI